MHANHKKLVPLVFLALWASRVFALDLPVFNLATAAGAEGWRAAHDIAKLRQTPDGLALEISGADPYVVGPARDYPTGTNLWLHLRLKSDQSGVCQVFYFRAAPSEPESVRFDVPAGQCHEAQVPMPPLGTGYHLRIDPPGNGGVCVLERVWFSERKRFSLPAL